MASPALGPTHKLSRLLASRGEAEGMLRLANEVCDHVPIFRIGSTKDPGDQVQGFAVHEVRAMQQNCVLMV